MLCYVSYVNYVVVMLISKSDYSEVSIKIRSTPVSLSFIGKVTKHTAVKWTILEGSLSRGACLYLRTDSALPLLLEMGADSSTIFP